MWHVHIACCVRVYLCAHVCSVHTHLSPSPSTHLPLLGSALLVQVRLKDFQHAAKAQRASVTPEEIARYEDYNERHGAKYVLGGPAGGGSDDDEW